MFRFLKATLVIASILAPLTLHSTDIYTSSQGLVKIRTNLNPTIIPGDKKLGSTILVVTTPKSMDNFRIESVCEHKDSVLYRDSSGVDSLSVVQVTFPSSCESPFVRIGNDENIFTDSLKKLPIQNAWTVKNELINTSSESLVEIMRETPFTGEKTGTGIVDTLRTIQSLYKNTLQTRRSDIARDILNDREQLVYISPVAGYSLPNKDVRIPGANRGYRIDTTDGIHHGWDIMAPYGTPVQSLAKGTVIRVVDDWKWATFGSLIRSDLTSDNRLTNLDIYRGNQIWLQTMDGNVTFYSHLSKIAPDIRVGSEVPVGTYLGNIWRTGVPDRDYKDLHLHFEIQENPHLADQKNPTTLEIMRWDYIGKGLNKGEIYKKMKEIFR